MIDEKTIDLCAEQWDSFYLYDEKCISESIEELQANFPQIEFLYSMKCNSHPYVLRSIFKRGFGADAASAAEVQLAHISGLTSNKIYYSAPGKSTKDIESTIDKAIIIADSLDEIKRIQEVAKRSGKIVNIGMRVNPDFTFDGDGGQASKFGIDEKQAIAFVQSASYENIRVTGIHVHLKSQVLNAETLAAYYERMFQLAKKFTRICGTLEYVNMGSGMGIQYAPTDSALDILALGQSVQKKLDAFHIDYPDTKIMIEVGRFVACKSGLYVTKVMDRKVSHGKTYLILKNTLNGFIRPSLAKLVARYSPDEAPAGSEPLFTSKDAFEIFSLKKDGASETVTLVGNLCTAIDVIAEDIVLPHLECGDLIAITNAGSYAAVLSPIQFSTQEKPQELFVDVNGEVLSD